RSAGQGGGPAVAARRNGQSPGRARARARREELDADGLRHDASGEPDAQPLCRRAGRGTDRRLCARPRRIGAERIAGRRSRRRGGGEQKGALAGGLGAVKTAADRLPLRGRLVFTVSTAGETGRHDAAISICDALGFSPKLAVIVIGTTSRVTLANKGRIDAIVTVRGKASHSSTPWVGVNAIDGARRVLDRVMAVEVGGNKHAGLGQATLTPTSMRSWPEATHTVQDEVRLVFDRRLLPGDDPQPAFAAIATAADIGEPWQVKTEFGPFMHPAEIAPDGQFMRAVKG